MIEASLTKRHFSGHSRLGPRTDRSCRGGTICVGVSPNIHAPTPGGGLVGGHVAPQRRSGFFCEAEFFGGDLEAGQESRQYWSSDGGGFLLVVPNSTSPLE